jgi:4-amino-4-deoxy-L-arabinose transferase-like glycosyltransferase
VITAAALVWAAFGSLFMFDTLLASSALLALLGVVHVVELGHRRGFVYIAAGLTLGILAKGPVVFVHVLPAAVCAPWWATPRADRHWGRWYAGLAAAVMLGVGGALVWAIPAGMAGGPEYRQAIFLGQTTGRMTQSFAHQRALWWYLPLLPVLLFPWFMWPESWRALRALRIAPRDAGVRFALVWALAGVLAFSLVSGKQVHYLLPLVPAAALLLARGLSQREAAPLARPWIVALVISVIALGVIAAGTTALVARVVWWPHDTMAWWWAVFPLAAAVMLVVWQRGWITRNAAVHSLAVTTAALLCGVQLAAGRAGTVPYDTAPMAAAVRSALESGHPVAMVGTYNGEYHFEGRLQRRHIDVIDARNADAWLRAHTGGLLLRYDRGRNAPPPDGVIARHPFRNGWASLAPSWSPKRATSDTLAETE